MAAPIKKLISNVLHMEKRAEKTAASATRNARKEVRRAMGKSLPKNGGGGKKTGNRHVEVSSHNAAKRNRQDQNNTNKLPRHGRGVGGPAFSGLRMSSSRNGGVCIRNRETLNLVLGTGEFSIQYNQLVNPRNILMFPWMSGIARKFDQYQFKSLSFTFSTSMGNAITGTGMIGKTLWTMIYDSDDVAPTDYVGFSNTDFYTELVVSDNHTYRMRKQCGLFQRYYIQHNEGEQDLESPGYIMFGTFGLPTNGVIGSLQVSYEVELFLPKMEPTASLSTASRTFNMRDALYNNFRANPLSSIAGSGGDLCVLTANVGVVRLHFPVPGNYRVSYALTIVTSTPTGMVVSSAESGGNVPIGPENFDSETSNGAVRTYTGARTFQVIPRFGYWVRDKWDELPSGQPDWFLTFDASAVNGLTYLQIVVTNLAPAGPLGQANRLTGTAPIVHRREDELRSMIQDLLRENTIHSSAAKERQQISASESAEPNERSSATCTQHIEDGDYNIPSTSSSDDDYAIVSSYGASAAAAPSKPMLTIQTTVPVRGNPNGVTSSRSNSHK